MAEVRDRHRVGQNVASHDGVRVVGLVDRQIDRREESEINREVRVRIGISVVGRFGHCRKRDGLRDNALPVERIAVVVIVDVVVGIGSWLVAGTAEEPTQSRTNGEVGVAHTHDIVARKERVESILAVRVRRRARDERIDTRREVAAAVGVLVQIDPDARDAGLTTIKSAVVIRVVPDEIAQRERLEVGEVDRLDRGAVDLNQLQLTIDRLASGEFHFDGTDSGEVGSASRLCHKRIERQRQDARRCAAGVWKRDVRR